MFLIKLSPVSNVLGGLSYLTVGALDIDMLTQKKDYVNLYNVELHIYPSTGFVNILLGRGVQLPIYTVPLSAIPNSDKIPLIGSEPYSQLLDVYIEVGATTIPVIPRIIQIGKGNAVGYGRGECVKNGDACTGGATNYKDGSEKCRLCI